MRHVSDDVAVVEDVTVVVNGRQTLGPLSFRIQADEHWALLGPNGAGKTTLLSLVGAERHPTTGSVVVLGERIGRTDLRELRTRIGVVGHMISDRLPYHATALEVTLTGRDGILAPWWTTFSEAERASARALLEQQRCGRLMDQPFGRCSQGERQRILIARSMFGRHRLLLLDEPAVGVDLPGREALVDSLDDLASALESPATLHVVHALEELPRSTTHALLLRDGQQVASGRVDDVLVDRALSDCFGIAITVTKMRGRYHATAERP